MTRTRYLLFATLGSAGLMLGALAFQHIGGLAPCTMCIWQRYPHVAAIALGVIALVVSGRLFPLLGAAAALTTAGIGLYHTGVERNWWEGPTTCTSTNNIGALSTDQLLEQIMTAPVVRCDEVPWELFTLSMASWNALISLVLVSFWIMAAARSA